jgi:hypothetical protein
VAALRLRAQALRHQPLDEQERLEGGGWLGALQRTLEAPHLDLSPSELP